MQQSTHLGQGGSRMQTNKTELLGSYDKFNYKSYFNIKNQIYWISSGPPCSLYVLKSHVYKLIMVDRITTILREPIRLICIPTQYYGTTGNRVQQPCLPTIGLFCQTSVRSVVNRVGRLC